MLSLSTGEIKTDLEPRIIKHIFSDSYIGLSHMEYSPQQVATSTCWRKYSIQSTHC